MPLRAYRTGLITTDQPGTYPPPPWKGRGWHAVLERARPNERESITTHYTDPGSNAAQVVSGSEVVVMAPSRISAQRGLDGIWAALHMLQGNPPFTDQVPEAFPADEQLSEGLSPLDLKRLEATRFHQNNICLATYAGAKASHRRDLTYALALYHLSQSIHSNYHITLDPFHSPNIPLSAFPSDHVRFAYAIVTAYAVLEQLGLEIRASQKAPSRIGGVWNPPVKADLEKRLRARHVDLSDSALLDLRGPGTRIERTRPVAPILRRASWARGQVRDVEVEVVDAIAHVSWLRSKVAAHKMGELVPALSIYDVANAQYLARRLLSSALGLWRHHQRPQEPEGYEAPPKRKAHQEL